MIPTDCESDINPAVMNPTTKTVVTEEDWMMAVTNAPGGRPHESIGSQLGKDRLHPLAGNGLQRLGHLLHTKQEQRQTAEQLHAHCPPGHLLLSARSSKNRKGREGHSSGYHQQNQYSVPQVACW